jgi:signal transduction histidine kinase
VLDTKLKNSSDRKGAGLYVSVVLLSILAAIIVLLYKPIAENAKVFVEKEKVEKQEQLNEFSDAEKKAFLKKLYQGTYVLKWDLDRQKNNKKLDASGVFLDGKDTVNSDTEVYDTAEGDSNTNTSEDVNSYSTDDYEDSMNMESFKEDFANLMNDWSYDFYYNSLSTYALEYYGVDNQSGQIITNTGTKLNAFLDSENMEEDIKQIQEDYYFYTVIKFDKDGNATVPYFNGIMDNNANAYLAQNLTQQMVERNWGNPAWYASRVKKPSDMTVIYAVRSEEALTNVNTWQYSYLMDQLNNSAYGKAGGAYLFAVAMMIVVLLGLLLPVVKPLRVGKGIEARVPIEICLAGFAVTVAFYSEIFLPLINETVWGDLFELNANNILDTNAARGVSYVFNILLWAVILLVWFVGVLSIRELFIKGPIRYVKENSLTGRFLNWIIRNIRKFLRYTTSFDMSKKDNKKLLLLLGCNMLLLIVFCLFWFVGIFAVIIYTGVLLYQIKKHKDKLASDYQVILAAASNISEGELDISIDKDLGVFNSLRDELMEVQTGFRRAVLEETKSQKMKTELITNVSHDLKTPLTAIITYIDLLKDKNISEEQKESYVETLDRKALRLKILIEDLFEMSKAASNTITIHPIEMDLTALIKQVHFEMSDRITAAEIDFRVRMPEDKVIVKLDSDKSYRIFENLLNNMCKYAQRGSRAYLDMEIQDKQTVITLRNISSEELDFSGEEIVERFVRGDKARNSEGSGLGLAIAKSFTGLQNGTFTVTTDGDLFKVVIVFPLVKNFSGTITEEE